MLRRIGVLASLAVMATMFAGVQSASAQTAGVCVFEGLAGTLTPGIPNALTDLNPTDWEQGSYVYNGNTAVCAGTFNGSPDVGANVSINSSGYYDNLLCGTGFAHDLDGSNTTVSGTGVLGTSISVSGAGYQIPFVAGVGPLIIGGNQSLPARAGAPAHAGASGLDANHGGVSSAYTGLGVVQITPGQGAPSPTRDNCITPDLSGSGGPDGETNSFEVKGFFVAAG